MSRYPFNISSRGLEILGNDFGPPQHNVEGIWETKRTLVILIFPDRYLQEKVQNSHK
jgi:hypothetical protein